MQLPGARLACAGACSRARLGCVPVLSGLVPAPPDLEVGLDLRCAFRGVTCEPQKQEGPCCRTSFPNTIGPLFSVFNMAEGGASQLRAWFSVGGRPLSQPWQ